MEKKIYEYITSIILKVDLLNDNYLKENPFEIDKFDNFKTEIIKLNANSNKSEVIPVLKKYNETVKLTLTKIDNNYNKENFEKSTDLNIRQIGEFFKFDALDFEKIFVLNKN
ncbi:MAG: hypothetical protein IPP61_10000 [Cytophagaceae bacterium]|nr:hypothetical protein [Cytophagaceae bacterium]